MGFTHNSKLAENEPDWGQVDKTRLPRPAFADQGEEGKKSTWGYPHHWVEGGGDPDADGVYTTGTLYLHRGGLAAARAAAGGARAGVEASAAVKAHLADHAKEIGMGEEAQAHQADGGQASALCQEIPADVPEWVMIARTGAWDHPTVGRMVITPELLASALGYYERNNKGKADVPIDYHHASVAVARGTIGKAPAAGWINGMEVRAGGTELWAHVLWTAQARTEITAREFRYLSPHIQFNAPDRVTGTPVPMRILTVALTNTPFLTELEALNENRAAAGGVQPGRGDGGYSEQGGKAMRIVELVAQALGKKPEEAASVLGLAADAEDKVAAEAVCAQAAQVKELAAKVASPVVVCDAIGAMLGVPAGAPEAEVKAKIIALQAGGDLGAVKTKLGLAAEAPVQDVLNVVGKLQETRHRLDAEELIADAIKSGKVPPAQREFYLNAALGDIEATRLMLRGAPVITALAQQPHKVTDGAGKRALTDLEAQVCRQLRITAEAFLAAG